MFRNFEELSGASSSSENSSSDDDESTSEGFKGADGGKGYETIDAAMRAIIHADVDCFYCQCEVLDRKLDPARPLAIGQKHIVVTCNYAARELGITKLMGREDAQRCCPSLLIVDGSDLERYRVHGRNIYESFRRTFQKLQPDCAVCKGSMDEMMADVTGAGPSPLYPTGFHRQQQIDQSVYIYNGNDPNNGVLTFVDDQSGAKTRLSCDPNVAKSSEKCRRHLDGDCLLQRAVTLALIVRTTIRKETGFTVTMGASYNPLLAKLASGLKKPGTVNVIQSGSHIRHLVGSMPLRKIPGIGHRTMNVLLPCLLSRFGDRGISSQPWTCRDLLQVPRTNIIKCLDSVKSGDKSSADNCSTLLDLCAGHDPSCVTDDMGGLQKTLSVENSFRNGSIRTHQHVLAALEDLYTRLPRVLANRTKWSSDPMKSYPVVIRLTVRSARIRSEGKVHETRSVRVPSVTRSQQVFFNGRPFVQDNLTQHEATALLRRSLAPLLQSLVFTMDEINLTRINICVCNFQDLLTTRKSVATIYPDNHSMRLGSDFTSKERIKTIL